MKLVQHFEVCSIFKKNEDLFYLDIRCKYDHYELNLVRNITCQIFLLLNFDKTSTQNTIYCDNLYQKNNYIDTLYYNNTYYNLRRL